MYFVLYFVKIAKLLNYPSCKMALLTFFICQHEGLCQDKINDDVLPVPVLALPSPRFAESQHDPHVGTTASYRHNQQVWTTSCPPGPVASCSASQRKYHRRYGVSSWVPDNNPAKLSNGGSVYDRWNLRYTRALLKSVLLLSHFGGGVCVYVYISCRCAHTEHVFVYMCVCM